MQLIDNENENQLPPIRGLFRFLLVAKNQLYVLVLKQNYMQDGIYYTSCGALAGLRNHLMG